MIAAPNARRVAHPRPPGGAASRSFRDPHLTAETRERNKIRITKSLHGYRETRFGSPWPSLCTACQAAPAEA